MMNITSIFRGVAELQSEEEIRWRYGIYFDVFQVLLVLGYCLLAFLDAVRSETNAIKLAQKVADVPWTESQIEITVKIGMFFEAMDAMEDQMAGWKNLNILGFAVLAVILRRIVFATDIHPRLGVLIATIKRGLDGLSHFAILFTLVFVLFSSISCWSFANDYDDFKDINAAMTTQFMLFILELPPVILEAFKEPSHNLPLVIYAVFSIGVESFLMCNFLVSVCLI